MKRKKSVFIFSEMPSGITRTENAGMLILAVISGLCSILQIYAVSGFINTALRSVHNSLFRPGISSAPARKMCCFEVYPCRDAGQPGSDPPGAKGTREELAGHLAGSACSS